MVPKAEAEQLAARARALEGEVINARLERDLLQAPPPPHTHTIRRARPSEPPVR